MIQLAWNFFSLVHGMEKRIQHNFAKTINPFQKKAKRKEKKEQKNEESNKKKGKKRKEKAEIEKSGVFSESHEKKILKKNKKNCQNKVVLKRHEDE